jgi:hypothetical protein
MIVVVHHRRRKLGQRIGITAVANSSAKMTLVPLSPARDCLALEAVTAGWLMKTVHCTRWVRRHHRWAALTTPFRLASCRSEASPRPQWTESCFDSKGYIDRSAANRFKAFAIQHP